MSNTSDLKFSERLDASFIEGDRGPLFCIRGCAEHSDNTMESGGKSVTSLAQRHDEEFAGAGEAGDHFVLFIPPFGEEINLCRRFYSLVRIQLVQAGLVTVQPDLYGTGDSAGLFEDSDWELWQDDLIRPIQHYCDAETKAGNVNKLSIVAVRAGCLLAADLIQRVDEQFQSLALHNLVFVQPERFGEDVVNRLFRSRVMAQRFAGDKSQNTQDLWSLIEQGDDVHASGHMLSSRLCKSLQQKSLDDVMKTTVGEHRTLFNVQTMNTNSEVNHEELLNWLVINCPSALFWQSYDVEPDASLIEAVVEALVE